MFLTLITSIILGYTTLLFVIKSRVHRLLRLSIAAAVLMWYLAPAALAIVYSYDRLVNAPVGLLVGANEFQRAFVFESLMASMILGLLLVLTSQRTLQQPRHTLQTIPHMLLILAFVGFSAFTSVANQVTYASANSAALYATRDGAGLLSIIGSVLLSGVIYCAVAAPTRRVFVSALLAITADSAFRALSGSRISLATPLIVIAFASLDARLMSRRNIRIGASLAIVAALVLVTLSTSIAEQRQLGVISISSVLTASVDGPVNAAASVFNKFNSFSAGSSLLHGTTGPGSAGVSPLVGAALAVIPRSLLPGRPVAGSSDGTIYGHPSRIAARTINPNAGDSANVGVSPGHIAVWELGWFWGPVFFVAFDVALLLLIDWLLHGSIPRVLAGISLLTIPTFHKLFAPPDVVILQTVIAFGILVLVAILSPTFAPQERGTRS